MVNYQSPTQLMHFFCMSFISLTLESCGLIEVSYIVYCKLEMYETGDFYTEDFTKQFTTHFQENSPTSVYRLYFFHFCFSICCPFYLYILFICYIIFGSCCIIGTAAASLL